MLLNLMQAHQLLIIGIIQYKKKIILFTSLYDYHSFAIAKHKRSTSKVPGLEHYEGEVFWVFLDQVSL